jgi:hypothetical protein
VIVLKKKPNSTLRFFSVWNSAIHQLESSFDALCIIRKKNQFLDCAAWASPSEAASQVAN